MIEALTALLNALTAYFNSAKIRETRALRLELKQLRHEIRQSVNNPTLLAELQDYATDAGREYKTLLGSTSNNNIKGRES